MSFCLRKSAASLLALALTTTPVFGAGFGIYENGAKASGMAGAWVAQADEAAANWYNPAALVWLEGSELQFGTNLITAGGDTEITSSDPRFGLFNEQTFEMESNLATPSHFYFRQSVNPNFAWGIGINNPFGLVTDWQQRPVTFSARTSELVTFYVNPNVALRLTETLSIGLGVTYVDAEIEEFSREIPIDLDGNPLNGFEVIGSSDLTGTGDDFGWNVALHQKGNGYSFGLTYRSGVTVGIDGNIDFENFGPLSPFFNDSPGTADLELPDVAAIALAWQGSTGWTYEIDVVWTGWSVFETPAVDIDNNVPGFVEDIDLREDWDDTLSYRLGFNKQLASGNEWRFGVLFEEGAVPEDTLRPSIPDADRLSPTIGYSFNGNKWSFDTYYMALFIDDITAEGVEEGVIQADYESFVHLAGVTASYTF